MPGMIGTQMPARARALEEAQVVRVVEAELRDDAVGAGIDLGLEVVEVGGKRRAFGMLLGIAGDGDLEVRDLLEAGDEIGRVGVAAGMRLVRAAGAAGGIAAQRHDVADADVPVVARDLVDLRLRRLRRR